MWQNVFPLLVSSAVRNTDARVTIIINQTSYKYLHRLDCEDTFNYFSLLNMVFSMKTESDVFLICILIKVMSVVMI